MKTIDEQLALAKKAQLQIDNYSQEQVDEMCLAIGWEVYKDDNIEKLAKMAVEETAFGNVESKIIKHKRKVGGVLYDIKGVKSVGLMERNEESGISKYANEKWVVFLAQCFGMWGDCFVYLEYFLMFWFFKVHSSSILN